MQQSRIFYMSEEKETILENSLTDFTANVLASGMLQTAQVSKTDTAMVNNRYNLIFNNRALLSQLYVEHGIVQTLIDQPVDDAFRGGIDIKTEMLSQDEITELECYIEKNNILDKEKQTIKWGRLFGGSGLVINTAQKPDTELNIEKINEYSPLDFYPADLWELQLQHYENSDLSQADLTSDIPYMLYGKRIHKSRVLTFKGKEAPSFLRRRMRGWGMSEVERLIRSINQYFKNQNVIFELLDEAKVDVYKIKGFNESLATFGGTEQTSKRVQQANMLKNFLNALTMDAEDSYEQKHMNFSGLGEMLTQIKQGVASDLRIPVTKLFGVSSAGFNSGEDDIENYNAMVESEIRSKCKHHLIQLISICSQKLFGVIPDDLEVEFKPLRILSAEQEENVKSKKFERIMSAVSLGLVTPKEARQAINKAHLLPIDVDDSDEDIYDNGLNQGQEQSDIAKQSNIPTKSNIRIADESARA